MKKKLLWAACALASAAMLIAGCTPENTGGDGPGTDPGTDKGDVTAPVITVTNVPETCSVGDLIALPAATAVDDVDGNVTENIKVTATRLNAEGEVNLDLLWQKPGYEQQYFTVTSNVFLNYKITYTCADAAGNVAEKVFDLVATKDDQTGTFELNDFDAAAGINIVAGNDVTLPSATAIDEPGHVNISERVQAKLYEIVGGVQSETPFMTYSNFKKTKKTRIPAGNYVLVYSVSDIAGNAFETEYKVPVSVAQPQETNLAYDSANFVVDNQRGKSWINEYGEVAFGNTSALPTLEQSVGFSASVTKIHSQYVGLSFNADAPGANGANFYTLSARGSANRDSLPNVLTCTWPSYLFLRMSKTGFESLADKNGDNRMTTVKGCNTNLLDGKDHTLYVQWRNEGASAEAADAKISIYGWIDKTPAGGTETADFIFSAVSGEKSGTGTLQKDIFKDCWEATGAGWFGMDCVGFVRPYGDDHMRIKGFVVYDAEEKDFAADISAPVVTATFDESTIYALGTEIAVPAAETDGGEEVTVSSIAPDGTKTAITEGKFTPDRQGKWQLLYEAHDAAGNYGHLAFTFQVAVVDTQKPEITVSSEEAITVKVGTSVTLPTATAIDNVDGDLTELLTVEVLGSAHATGLLPGGTYHATTAGVQKIIYSVADSYGNVATKEITLTVTSESQGNLLASPFEIDSSKGQNNIYAATLPIGEDIYDQKVSMVLNVSSLKTLVMFNVRGPAITNEWPKGLVIRLQSNGSIDVSSHAHDASIYGQTSWDPILWKYALDTDFLFEFENKNVTIGDTAYLRTRIWIQGVELDLRAVAGKGGIVGLETDIKGIYRKLSDFDNDAERENLYSTPFIVSAYDAKLTVKELRIDGQSCTLPEGPKVPEGLNMPTFAEGNDFVGTPVDMDLSNDGGVTVLGKNSNEDYISFTFKAKAGADGTMPAKGCFLLNITGPVTNNGWAGGLILRVSGDGWVIHAGGINDNRIAQLAIWESKPFDGREYTVVYKLTYVKGDDGMVTGIDLDMWYAVAGGQFAKAGFDSVTGQNAEDRDGTLFIGYQNFTNATIVPGDISYIYNSILDADCGWTVTKIEKLEKAPGSEEPAPEAEGLNMPTFAEGNDFVNTPVDVNVTNDGGVTVLGKNSNEDYISFTFKAKAGADGTMPAKGCFLLNLTGPISNYGWNGGLILRFSGDGWMVHAGGFNDNPIAQLAIWEPKPFDGKEYTIVYKLTYVKDATGTKVIGIDLDMWFAVNGGQLAKVGIHSVVGKDAEKRDTTLFIGYQNFTDETIVPGDISFAYLSPLNGTCGWTVTKIEKLGSAPGSEE